MNEGDYFKELTPEYYAKHLQEIKRFSRIMKKVRKAGIPKEDIDFILDFCTRDGVHVEKLCRASDAQKRAEVEGN